MIASLQGFVGENISLLAPVADAWQPTDYLPDICRQPERYVFLAEKIAERAAEQPPTPFSWLHDRRI